MSEYKYLGIIFKPSGSFSFAKNYLSKKASKAMFCIRKTLYSEKLNAFLHLRLFDARVKPILLYCSEIWSLDILIKRNSNFESKYDSFVPNKTQIKFAKFVLVVHKSATNIAVLSELGLFPLSLCTIKATINYWLHLLSANANSLIYHSYQENTLRKDGLCSKIKLLLAEIGFTHVWVNQGTFFLSLNYYTLYQSN